MMRTALASLCLVFAVLAAPAPCRGQQANAATQSAAQAAAEAREIALRDALIERRATEEAAARARAAALEPPTIDAADVSVRYLRTGSVDAGEAAGALSAQAKRRFFVRGADGSVSGPYTNIDSFGGDVVVLHDRTTLLPELESALASFVVVSSPPEPPRETLQTVEYRPRHEKVSNLLRALEPFARRISNDSDGSAGGPIHVSNVTILQESGVLVLRDSPVHLEEMLGVLARIDVPAPQVMLSCLLIQDVPASDTEDATAGLPEDLRRDLHSLLPVDALRRVGQAALRVAIVPGNKATLRGQLEGGQDFMLTLLPTGYDRESGSLSVTDCVLLLDGNPMFSTSAVLAAGENTVIGASGIEPLFVVLRVLPLDG